MPANLTSTPWNLSCLSHLISPSHPATLKLFIYMSNLIFPSRCLLWNHTITLISFLLLVCCFPLNSSRRWRRPSRCGEMMSNVKLCNTLLCCYDIGHGHTTVRRCACTQAVFLTYSALPLFNLHATSCHPSPPPARKRWEEHGFVQGNQRPA